MLAYLHDPFESLMFWLAVLASVLVVGAALLSVILYLYLKRRRERKAKKEEAVS